MIVFLNTLIFFLTGLFNLVKLPRLNSLMCHMPDTSDLAFKLRRKKFMIEVGGLFFTIILLNIYEWFFITVER